MDQETLRLIVTAGVALIAGLGGAGLSSWVNRKNTVETLAAAVERDHATWLRTHQQEAYAEFLAKAEAVIHAANSNPNSPMPAAPPLDDMSIACGRLTLVGGAETIDWSKRIDFEARRAVIVRMQMDKAEADSAEEMQDWISLTSATRDFHSLVGRFVDAARTEIGTGPAPETENDPGEED
ncbi:hypothetical protein [Arthrobacter sp. 18067]|uniref:hypothetical protein n=1 Tax=Arthrobacter sp. 18067 TaxID=2681413 RepID=UPI001358F160|nr:hypothetical protein [Arthrobacter sp. 18067]